MFKPLWCESTPFCLQS